MSWEFVENKQNNSLQAHRGAGHVLDVLVQYNQLMDNIKQELKNLEIQPKTPQNRTNIMRLKLIKKNTEKQWTKFIQENIK